MKRLWAIAAALTLALPAFARAAAAPSMTRRALLLRDIKEMLDFIPAAANDPVDVKYRDVFKGMFVEAGKTSAVTDLKGRFEGQRNDYFNALLSDQHKAFNDDPAAFRTYVLKRYHLAVVLDRLSENKNIKLDPKQLQMVNAWIGQLNAPTVSVSQLDALTTQIGSIYRNRADGQGRYWTGQGLTLRSDFQPKQASPDRGVPPPAPAVAAVTPVSFSVPPVVSSLSNFISSVGRKAKGYAQQVATAIVNSSAARSIDASLTTALVWAESTFSRTVGSYASCVGLGQLSEGVAEKYHVADRQNVDQNLKGTTGYLREQLDHFTSHDDRAYVNGLFAQEAVKVRNGADVDAEFRQIWPRIPNGMKNAVAAYNAGPGRIDQYGSWDKLPLPRRVGSRNPASGFTALALAGRVDENGKPLVNHCWDRPDNDSSFCQTMDYVPKVLSNYFTVYVHTTPDRQSASTMSAAAATDSPHNG